MSQKTWNQCQSNMLRCRNYADEQGNPAGGYVHGPGLCIAWQDGPRGKDEAGELLPANGAFVEDAIAAAFQRLAFFQDSKFKHEANAKAMEHLQAALDCLQERALARQARGVLGQNTV